MKQQSNKMLVIWNIILTVLVVVLFAASASWAQAANDPPVRVFTATMDDVGSDYYQSIADVVIDSNTPKVIGTITTDKLSPDHEHTCTVIGSASAQRTTDGNGVYRFGISMNTAGAFTAVSERLAEFTANAGFDQRYEEVTSIYTANEVKGNNTFRFLARKNAPGDPNMTVTAMTMTVICFKKLL